LILDFISYYHSGFNVPLALDL